MTATAMRTSRKGESFTFGENWRAYAAQLTPEHVEEATRALARLMGPSLAGRTFLDIGCGSGVHALAADRLGCRRILAIDVDPLSVLTTRTVLERFETRADWRCEPLSVFELDPLALGTFDVVYSWGVLHHSGALRAAAAKAAAMVAPGGRLVVALYRRTRLCRFWAVEKRFYKDASPRVQRLLRGVYVAAFRAGCALSDRSFRDHVAGYPSRRGMEFHTDVHDWLGGWPYESIAPDEAVALLERQGLVLETAHTRAGRPWGWLGSGCDEYVLHRP